MSKLQRQSQNWARTTHKGRGRRAALAPKLLDAWPQRLLAGFRRILTGLFSPPHRPRTASLQRAPAVPDEPKRSCSSYLYPLNAHYDEAITDCIEFFNRSSQDTRISIVIAVLRWAEWLGQQLEGFKADLSEAVTADLGTPSPFPPDAREASLFAFLFGLTRGASLFLLPLPSRRTPQFDRRPRPLSKQRHRGLGLAVNPPSDRGTLQVPNRIGAGRFPI
ncbi:hypothetical protein GW17_00004785 [Ensete ventricosum]|nr:hypothetical protein GW17_00004785 [Ensete ventricosum]